MIAQLIFTTLFFTFASSLWTDNSDYQRVILPDGIKITPLVQKRPLAFSGQGQENSLDSSFDPSEWHVGPTLKVHNLNDSDIRECLKTLYDEHHELAQISVLSATVQRRKLDYKLHVALGLCASRGLSCKLEHVQKVYIYEAVVELDRSLIPGEIQPILLSLKRIK